MFVHDQECAEAVEVVGLPGAVDVVPVIADAGADDDRRQRGQAVGAERDPAEHALVAALGDGRERDVDVAALGRAGDRERDHRGAGRLGPVVGSVAPVDDLEPQAGRRVLMLLEPSHQVAEDPQQLGPPRVVVGDDLEDVDHRHAVPADRAAPVLGGEAGVGVGPGLDPRLVVGVSQEPARLL